MTYASVDYIDPATAHHDEHVAAYVIYLDEQDEISYAAYVMDMKAEADFHALVAANYKRWFN